MNKKCCVIIVTYNAQNWLDFCLTNFKESEYTVVVVDNKSTDNTCKIIEEKYPEVILYTNNKNLGFGQANNIAMRYAYDNQYQHVLLLNQDANIKKEDVDELIKIQNKYEQYYILAPLQYNGKGTAFDSGFSQYIKTAPRYLFDISQKKEIKEVYDIKYTNAACWLISHRCLNIVGGFSSAFYHYGEDDNYLDRMYYYHGKLGLVPDAKVLHDREFRKETKFQDEIEVLYRSNILVPLSNPKNNFYKISLKIFIKNLLKSLVNIMMFNFKRSYLYFKLIYLQLFNSNKIYKNLKISINKKRAFL